MGKETILVTDNSPPALEVISKFLIASGFAVFTAGDGIEATEKAFREQPDLMILDVMTPRMNGYQICRLLKSDHETCDIPIIMLTSDNYRGIQTGADVCLPKESEQTTLLKTIETLIQKRRKRSVVKSPTRETRLITAVDIVSKVNEHLDNKLYAATVLSEMSSLAEKRTEDFKDTVTVVMETLAKVWSYGVGVIVIIKERNVECFFVIRQAISEQRLKEIQEYTIAFLKEKNICLNPVPVMEVYGDEKTGRAGIAETQKFAYFTMPVHCFNTLGGLVILAHNVSKTTESEENVFFSVLARQAYMIIENSWFYHKVKKLSITDSLTGIYNHSFLYRCLAKEYSRAERYRLPLSLLMLDIDYFKKINDTHGHPQGDAVLYKLSRILAGNIRVCDTLGRYGGEEFSIILPESNLEDAANLAERIRAEVEQYNFGDTNRVIKCTISIGVSCYPGPGIKSLEDMAGRADKALYNAKADGRNRVCII